MSGGSSFDASTDTVGFYLDDMSIIIPPNSFEINGNIYTYKNKKVKMILDFDKNAWSIRLKKISAWSKATTMDGINIYLMIGDAVGAELQVHSSTRLKYKPKRTRYSENIK